MEDFVEVGAGVVSASVVGEAELAAEDVGAAESETVSDGIETGTLVVAPAEEEVIWLCSSDVVGAAVVAGDVSAASDVVWVAVSVWDASEVGAAVEVVLAGSKESEGSRPFEVVGSSDAVVVVSEDEVV